MRVLIVRLRALGDVIHALPVACAIKDEIPGAQVGWLAEGGASEVLIGHPAIDQCHVVEPDWTRWPRRILQLRRALQAARYDAVLDLQGVRSTVLAALLSGAPRRLGFIGMGSHELRRFIASDARQRALSRAIARPLAFALVAAQREHIVDRYLEILTPLGVPAPTVRFGLRESRADAAAIEALLRAADVQTAAYAVINPGGPTPRRWPPERFAEVARHLATQSLPTLLVQGLAADEQRLATAIADASGGHARLLPPLPVSRLAALARRSRLFISGDTGPLHLAAAVGAPCIGLIGHARAARFGPYGSGNILLTGPPPPTARHGGLGADAMRAIDAATVCRACDRLLETKA